MFAFLKNRFVSASTIAVATFGGGGTYTSAGIGRNDRTAAAKNHHPQQKRYHNQFTADHNHSQQQLLPFSLFNHLSTTSVGQNLMDEEYFLRKFEDYEKNDSWDYVFQRINLESETQAKKLSLCCDLSNSFHEKNRYRNVLPYDQNRITLKSVSSENDSYINASPLHLPFARRNYILTQGPLPNTASDFWQMIFEQKVSICIMLSKVMEKSFIKCHSYFPCKDSSKLKFENFECELEHEEIKPNYIIRRIRLIPLGSFRRNEQQQSKLGENEQPTNSSSSLQQQQQFTRIIHHFQFTTWPDFGVPEHTDHFLEFLGEVRSAREKLIEQENHSSTKLANPPPIVCHCSAGIGRTGTFVIVDSVVSMIQKKRSQQQQKQQSLVERKESMPLAETTSAVELINTANNNNNNNESEVADKMVEEQLDSLEALVIFIRRHRMGLIQTSQQLRFCWKTIVDWIKKNNGNGKNDEQQQLPREPVNNSSLSKVKEASPTKDATSTNIVTTLTDIRWSTSPSPQLEEQPPPRSSPSLLTNSPNPSTLIPFEATGNGGEGRGGNFSSPSPAASIHLPPLQQSSPSPQPPSSSSSNPFILAAPNGGFSPPCCPPSHPTQSPPH